jgi:hypothetical protein
MLPIFALGNKNYLYFNKFHPNAKENGSATLCNILVNEASFSKKRTQFVSFFHSRIEFSKFPYTGIMNLREWSQ